MSVQTKFIGPLVAEVKNAPLYQTIALVIFFLFFIFIIIILFKRPKKFYKNISELPLED